ncbi:peptide ABC transporter substrate-binding protein [Listeria weihenstephanensis]|uniref:Peptide ABC transporter substrate-binding protein n=1 Tax=Listeria weihenstephanensis TaxID=1006155 RepID=A0A841Z4D1_9LIST|nr:peptide ABC transporter substrate-binding protein [Listeria weihenstephanensis]MBC1499769.1 peptide ABC transporter substrate-binding protein [Listeria weihenstephanensis]
MKKGILITMIAVIGLVIAACGSDTTKDEVKGSAKQSIKVTSAGEIATLDSALYSDTFSSDAIGQISEGLYRVNPDNDAELGLAKAEPTVSADKKVYTFQLRDDAKWSNGEPVTAADFVFAFQKVVDPKTASPSSNQLDVIKNANQIRNEKAEPNTLGVKAIDDKTLEITLENPIPYLPKLLTGTPFLPQNEKFVKELGSKYGTSADTVLSNGPFLLKDWSGIGTSWNYVKNKDYWDAENVRLNKVAVQVAKDTGAGVNLYETGDVQYTALTDEFVQKYKDNKAYHSQSKSLIGYLGFNEDRKATGNVHLRKALSMAFDKDAYTQTILGDGSKALNGYIPSDFAKDPENNKDFRAENGDLVTFDPEKANSEWTTAKKELGIDKLTLEVLSSDTEVSKKTVEFLQSELEKNLPGLTVKIKSVPLKNRLALTTAGDYDIFYGTWSPDYSDPINFLEVYQSDGGINFSKYNSSTYDSGLNEVKSTLATDPEKRWDKMLELEQQLISQDAVIAPFYQGATAYLLNPEVQDVQIYPFGRNISFRLAYVK